MIASKLMKTLPVVLLLSGCVETGAATDCAGWRPIRLEAASIDGLTPRDAEAVLAHNIFGHQRGCW